MCKVVRAQNAKKPRSARADRGRKTRAKKKASPEGLARCCLLRLLTVTPHRYRQEVRQLGNQPGRCCAVLGNPD